MAALVSCSSCARHVRRSETACPFCGHALPPAPEALASEAVPFSGRLTRAMLLFASAAAVTGCGKETVTPPDAGVDAQPVALPAYGVPLPDTALATPPYGVAPPPPDAGRLGARDMGAVPPYGVSPQGEDGLGEPFKVKPSPKKK